MLDQSKGRSISGRTTRSISLRLQDTTRLKGVPTQVAKQQSPSCSALRDTAHTLYGHPMADVLVSLEYVCEKGLYAETELSLKTTVFAIG